MSAIETLAKEVAQKATVEFQENIRALNVDFLSYKLVRSEAQACKMFGLRRDEVKEILALGVPHKMESCAGGGLSPRFIAADFVEGMKRWVRSNSATKVKKFEARKRRAELVEKLPAEEVEDQIL